MTVTYLGHSCFLFDFDGVKVLTDPFITYNDLAKSIDKEQITCNYILLTHGHQDHMADAEYFVKKDNATIIAIFEIAEWFKNKGIDKLVHMNIGGKAPLPFGIIKMVTAVHSSVLPDGTYGGNPAGYVIQTTDKVIYFAGDTALTYDMKIIAELFGKVDVAFLPIGDRLTMDVEDALIAADWVNANKVIGMHYDTFPNIQLDKEQALQAAQQAGKELVLLAIGETVTI
ncbi:MAG: metal-dependent hydrolase [Bacteroidota bacterium]|nr:metal-dependent hydrolase [Bacteroidota bacterium]